MTFESKALRPKRSASAATSRVASSQVGSHPPKAGRRPPGGAVSSAGAGRRAARARASAIQASRAAR